jgi:hypothetical protein
MMLLRRKGATVVEIIPPVGGIISPTEVVLEMVEIIPQEIWGILYRLRRRIWPSMGRNSDILGEIKGKVIMVGVVVGVMKNQRMKMMNLDMMMMTTAMIMMVMVMRTLMMKAGMIKIRREIRRVGKEIGREIGVIILIRRNWIGEMMRKVRIWKRVGNMEMRGLEIGKIGVWTEQVPPAALNKCRQE